VATNPTTPPQLGQATQKSSDHIPPATTIQQFISFTFCQ